MPNEEIIYEVYIPLVQRHLALQMRDLISQLPWVQKIEATQVMLYEAGKKLGSPLLLLIPKEGKNNDKLKCVFGIAKYLSIEMLIEIATEILEEPRDENA